MQLFVLSHERDMEIKNFVSKKYLVGYSNEETNGEKIELIDKEKFEADSSNILTDEIKMIAKTIWISLIEVHLK